MDVWTSGTGPHDFWGLLGIRITLPTWWDAHHPTKNWGKKGDDGPKNGCIRDMRLTSRTWMDMCRNQSHYSWLRNSMDSKIWKDRS
jgi:hypothetical protein